MIRNISEHLCCSLVQFLLVWIYWCGLSIFVFNCTLEARDLNMIGRLIIAATSSP